MAHNKQKSDIRRHSFARTDRFFLDANIWFSVYGPIAYPNRRTKVYSAALRKMRTSKCTICVDVLVLSEFINSFARLVFNQLPEASKPVRFKDFRESDDFVAVSKEIAVNARKIIAQAERCELGFGVVDVAAILAEFESGPHDFNDQIIRELCKSEGLTLVTHDADFKGADIPILTANRRLYT